jgi:Domain of unknown function (DUF6259)
MFSSPNRRRAALIDVLRSGTPSTVARIPMRPILPSIILLSLSLASPALAQRVSVTADGFTASTGSIEITVSSGAVTRVLNKLTGETHTSPVARSAWMPRGVLAMPETATGAQAIQTLHSEWGSHPIYNNTQLAESIARIARYPGQTTTCTVSRTASGARAVYRGLTDGLRIYPDDQLTVDAVLDTKSGHIELTATATTATDALVGTMVPVVNLHANHAIYAASFGGMCYTPADLAAKRLHALNNAPYIEAPVLVAESRSGSIALWVEDSTFPTYAAFFGGDGNASALGIEQLNDMPFEGKRASRASRWKIAAFRGTWPNAMAPYRAWYARTFAPELAIRDSSPWARDISVIIDRATTDVATLKRLASVIEPKRVLFHEWNARQAAFDTMLPDWTPRAAFPEFVAAAHSAGFKTMAYVNSYCINQGSPKAVADAIPSFALTRPIDSVSKYTARRRTFSNATAGEVLYLDPLSAGWRRYHTDQMIAWRNATGVDALYEDTAGTAGDFGNGTVGGLRGAQGGWAQFRELLERNPMPMATEYAPDHMAFASTWALRYSQTWGTDDTRKLWESRHRPISPYLFGNGARAWVPAVAAETEPRKWTVLACSDALGGVAQFEANSASFDAKTGLARHMVDRAQLFAQLGLAPSYANWPNDPTIACQYLDRAGNLYRYQVKNGLQQLVRANGTPLYQRITGASTLATPLQVRGWPAYTATGPIGLNPAAVYALAPKSPEPAAATAIQVDKLPSSSSIVRYIETPDFVLARFAPVSASTLTASTTLGLVANADFAEVLVRDSSGRLTRRSTPLARGARLDLAVAEPVELLLVRRAFATPPLPASTTDQVLLAATPVAGKFVSDTTGLERGGSFLPPHTAMFSLSGSLERASFMFAAGGGDSEIAFDYPIVPPSADSAVEFTVRNTQKQYGNGSICRVSINGKVVFTEDLGPVKDATGRLVWDTAARICRVPVGSRAGEPIVVTIAIWGKGDMNADEIWMTEPRIIRDGGQTTTTSIVAVVE